MADPKERDEAARGPERALRRALAGVFEALRAHGLAKPGAFEDHPWGETALKVGKRVFAFLHHGERGLSLTTKLPQSGAIVLELPSASPTGYGLGASGWVTVRLAAKDDLPLDLLRELLDESYATIAPKRVARGELPAATKAVAKKAVAKKTAAKKTAAKKTVAKKAVAKTVAKKPAKNATRAPSAKAPTKKAATKP